MPQDQQWVIMALSFGLVVLVLGQRMLRKRKMQSTRVERLWMFPAFYTAAVFLLFGVHAPEERVWLFILVAFFGGAGLGWYRGKHMAILVDPRTQEVRQSGTTAVMMIVLLLLALRYGARFHATSLSRVDPAIVIAVTDVLLCLGLGFVVAQGVELFQRARALAAKGKGGTA
jgi:steroid 5-alpha reductase family enzyme